MKSVSIAFFFWLLAIGSVAVQVVDAQVCDILATPQSFDGKIVRIKGTVVAGFEELGSALPTKQTMKAERARAIAHIGNHIADIRGGASTASLGSYDLEDRAWQPTVLGAVAFPTEKSHLAGRLFDMGRSMAERSTHPAD